MSEFTDIVVVIPGISGSVLTKHGKTVWAPQAGAVLRAFFSAANSVRALALDGDDPDVDDLGDGVVATGLVQDLHVIPGLVKIDGYTGLRKALIRRLQLVPGETYFELPYDWRRHNVVAARRLRTLSEQWLAARRKTHPDAKLVLVGHSMGGIISRIFLDRLEGWRDTRRLVTFGTPYSGSLNALDNIANGMFVGKFGLGVDLSDTLRSFSSVYELLPSYRAIRSPATGEWVPLDDAAVDIAHMDSARLATAMALHRGLRDAVDANRATNYEGTGGYEIRPMVGEWIETKSAAELVGGAVRFLNERVAGETGGDGTVPRLSAIPHEALETLGNVSFVNERHGSLQNNRFSTDNLAALLRPVDDSGPFFPAEIPKLTVRSDDALLGQPVTIEAAAEIDNPDLACRIASVAGGPTETLPMVPDPADPRRASLVMGRPAPGDYRVTVSGPTTNAVTDVFSVVDADA